MAESYFIDKDGSLRFTLNIIDTAKSLRTRPTNITLLIKLGIIKPIKLSHGVSVPLSEVQKFIDKYAGEDISKIIAEKEVNNKVVAMQRDELNG